MEASGLPNPFYRVSGGVVPLPWLISPIYYNVNIRVRAKLL